MFLEVAETVPLKMENIRDEKTRKSCFEEFCLNTSIHGIKYFIQKKRTLVGKIWWSLIITVSIILCCIFIVRTYNHWKNSPVIVTFATEQTLISKIPFPAVTICPSIKANRSISNYTELLLKKFASESATDEEKNNFDYMSLVCNFDEMFYVGVPENRTHNESAVEFLQKISLASENVFVSARWQQRANPGLFRKILTSEGFCYTFNMLEPSQIFMDDVQHYWDDSEESSCWSLQEGYRHCKPELVYPRNTNAAGAKGGLSVILAMNEDDIDYLCVSNLQGFKISLHNPAEIPDVADKYFLIPLDQAVVGLIKPSMMKTRLSLESYKPSKRQCYFEGEKRLKYFKSYNQENCMLECQTNYTLSWCGCVKFYMPRTKNTPICSLSHEKCLDAIRATYLHEISEEMLEEYKNSTQECDCLPSCTSLDYEVQLSQTTWDWKEAFNVFARTKLAPDNFSKVPKVHLSTMILFYKDMQFMTQERTEIYGRGQLLANWGGLLGLFMGFSVISMFEVVYFLMVKLAAYTRQHGRKCWTVIIGCFMTVMILLFVSFAIDVSTVTM